MKLEIRNLQSSTTHKIDPKGAVIGREGALADITLKDNSVSKKHARIYVANGQWYLEDLASSNGTYLNDKRLTEPAVLAAGSIFSLSDNQFEVVEIEVAEATDLEAPAGGGAPLARPILPEGFSSSMWQAHTAEAQSGQRGFDQNDSDRDDAGDGGAPIVNPGTVRRMIALVPRLALDPFKTIRRCIAEQPEAPIGRLGLIVCALLAQLFVPLVGFFVTFVVASVGSSGGTTAGSFPIRAVLIAIALSVVLGLFWHPLLGLLLPLVRGTSNERSRTNCFIMMNAAWMLTAIPTGMGVLLGLAGIPLLGLLPILLSLYAMLILACVGYNWTRAFEAVRWFQVLVLVLGLLGCASSTLAFVDAFGAGLRTRGSAPDPIAPSPTNPSEAPPATPESGPGPGTGSGPGVPSALPEERVPDAGTGTPNASVNATPSVSANATPSISANANATPSVSANAVPVADAGMAMDAGAGVGAGAAPKATPSAPPFRRFIERRTAIEQAISEDPMLMRRKEIREPYERLLRRTFEVRSKWAKKRERDPAKAKINERLKDAEVYDATHAMVDELYERMFL